MVQKIQVPNVRDWTVVVVENSYDYEEHNSRSQLVGMKWHLFLKFSGFCGYKFRSPTGVRQLCTESETLVI